MREKREVIRERLQTIFRNVFEDEDLEIFDGTTADDIEEWDSVMHITLVMDIERSFGIRLNAADVGALLNVGSMIDLLDKHLNEPA